MAFVLVVICAFSFNLSAFAMTPSIERKLSLSNSSCEEIIPMSGTETLYSGRGSIGSFSLVGSNLTPVKTMGSSGTFTLLGTATASPEYYCIRVQIRDYPSGRVLCSTTTGSVSISNNNGITNYYAPSIWVNQGQQIQIYMDYISVPSRSATVSMNYILN